MAKSAIIKRLLAEAMERLLEKKKIDGITVNEIISEAGVSRTTFYRYFRDKFDLINWIYQQHLDEALREYRDIAQFYLLLNEMLTFMGRKRELFVKLLEYRGQNSFADFFKSSMISFDMCAVRMHASEEGVSRIDKYMFEFTAEGWTVAITRWLKDGCPESTEELMQILFDLTPYRLRKIYSDAINKDA